MRIEVEKSGDTYRADCKDLPGSPPVGEGKTKEEAVASLFYRLLFSQAEGTYWTRYIKSDTFFVVVKEEPCQHVWTSSLTGSTWCEVCGFPKED